MKSYDHSSAMFAVTDFCIGSCSIPCPDGGQPHRETLVWVKREQVSPPLQRRRVSSLSISHCRPDYDVLIGFPSWPAGVCWRSPSESRPSWHLCRPAAPNPSSWRRWRRWSPLRRSNSWRRCGFTSTSERPDSSWDASSVCWRFPRSSLFFSWPSPGWTRRRTRSTKPSSFWNHTWLRRPAASSQRGRL